MVPPFMHRERLMPDLLDKCRSCEEPIWDGPCKCKTWCKSRVCKASFIGKMSELLVDAQLANTVLTMDQWYEQTQQGRRERITQEREREPGPYSSCTCQWCREVDHRIQVNWRTGGRTTRYYGVRDSRGRFVGDVGNSVPLVQELQRNSPYPDSDHDT